MSTKTDLPLKGARKKPEPRPRSEGLVKLARRHGWYLRIYPAGAKRALYRCTFRDRLEEAAQVVPHLRAKIAREQRSRATPPRGGAATQPDLMSTIHFNVPDQR